MIWKFWQKKNKQDEDDLTNRELTDKIEAVGEDLTEKIARLANQLTGMEQGVVDNSLQATKLSRLQYKIGQETMAKLGQLEGKMVEGHQWQEAYQKAAAQLAVVDQQHSQVIQRMVTWLDELDLVIQGMQKVEQDSWYQLFQQWSSQILQLLDNLEISQVEVLGQTFDPRLAEAIGTVKAAEVNITGLNELEGNSVPCQVVQVVKRGYWETSSGKLLRKAQVITVTEKGVDEDKGDGEITREEEKEIEKERKRRRKRKRGRRGK